MISPEAVLSAAEQLAGIAHVTPVLTSHTVDNLIGCRVFFKCENFQRMGAFKFRGAYNAISRLSAAEKAAGVITHSSGNHAQGLALAANLQGIRAVVVMPEDAPANKRTATEGYGAEIVTCNALYREEVTAQLIADHGYTLVHPFDNDHIIAGQGTAALELFDKVGPLDFLFVPVGGGGLISGSALAAQLRSPGCRVIGVEPELGADANRSWREGVVHKLESVPQTIADGLRTRAIGRRNIEIMRSYLADMTVASEDEIAAALEFILARLKIVIEPSSAVAFAPLLGSRYHVPTGSRVGVLLSGGNMDVASLGLPGSERTSAIASVAAATDATPPAISSAASENRLPRILVCTPLEQPSIELLSAVGSVDQSANLDEETLTNRIGDYQALIVGPQQPVSAHVIKYGYNLRAIGCLDTRLANIDVSMARALGIEVCYPADSRAVALAEHTVGRLLTLAEQYADGRLAGKTLGLIGFGLVGRQVAQRAAAFDMHVLVNQPRLTPELALDAEIEPTEFAELLKRSDFISLHVPFRGETAAIVGRSELALMKPTAVLINVGHTDLVDEAALLDALNAGALAGAGLSSLPPVVQEPTPSATAVRRHPRVIVTPHVSVVLDNQRRDASLEMARQVAAVLQTRRPSDTLELEVVPVDQVVPHEHIDQKRVGRLMERLEIDGRLVNPPITTFWKGRYVILDGATRYGALSQLGYPYAIVQVVDQDRPGFQLHTWYHAISADSEGPEMNHYSGLEELLRQIEDLFLQPLTADEVMGMGRDIFAAPEVLCYFLDRDGRYTLARAAAGADRLAVMNALVDAYNAWGNVERTLLTDMDRLLAQFPRLVAVAVFPQFKPADVFDAAAAGNLLPAGLTRFVIPGRILRLNADLNRLKRVEPLSEKRAWFNEFLGGRLAHSRLRVYQEPVVLLDE